MSEEVKELLSRLIAAGIGAVFFVIWGIYWYRNVERVDRWMMDDWTHRLVEHIPKEERLKKLRRGVMLTFVTAAILFLFFLCNLAQILDALGS